MAHRGPIYKDAQIGSFKVYLLQYRSTGKLPGETYGTKRNRSA